MLQNKKLLLNKYTVLIVNIMMLISLLFFINHTASGYKTTTQVSTLNAKPIVSIETATPSKELEFIDYGWATHRFDIVNGKMGKDGIFYVNEIDMEYYVNVVKDSGELPLNLKALYTLNDDLSLNETPIPYVDGKGYGPFELPYKKDDELVLNPEGYYESKYVKRVRYLLVYTYGTCGIGDSSCANKIDVNEAGKDYKFHIEINTYQKVN